MILVYNMPDCLPSDMMYQDRAPNAIDQISNGECPFDCFKDEFRTSVTSSRIQQDSFKHLVVGSHAVKWQSAPNVADVAGIHVYYESFVYPTYYVKHQTWFSILCKYI